MGQNRNARKRNEKVKVDMNPMVDLAFLLLTFFMMATTFSKPQAMELIIPAKAEPGDEEKEQVLPESKVVSIVLAETDSAYIYRGLTDPEIQRIAFDIAELRNIMEEFRTREPEIMILIKAMDQAKYSHIVDILDELNQMEMTRYVLMDAEDTDLKLLDMN
jgi:biopolymer transport protein ExbD